jgi:hypothetical protein
VFRKLNFDDRPCNRAVDAHADLDARVVGVYVASMRRREANEAVIS